MRKFCTRKLSHDTKTKPTEEGTTVIFKDNYGNFGGGEVNEYGVDNSIENVSLGLVRWWVNQSDLIKFLEEQES